jgi:isopentenyldiphosphate isomerase
MKNPRSPAGTPAHPVHPSEEIFDVVNAQDEVIGAASRAEVHARGLVHRAVHVLVFNQRGEVFIQKRSMTKDKSPGLWDSSASGHLERGEDYDTCALRELREEIGLTPPLPPQRLFKLGACQETDQEHVWVYRCQSEGPFTLNPAEIERGEWVAPAVLTLRIAERPGDFASAFRFLWSRLPDAGPR